MSSTSGTSVQLEDSTRESIVLPPSRLGFLTEKQFRVLSLRSRGYSQREIAVELGMSRASVSMVEARAKRQVELARQTLRIYRLTQTQHKVTIDPGTRLQQIPMIVLQEADKFRIHSRSNMVDILRMVKRRKGSMLKDGRISDKIVFTFNERGTVSLL